MDNYTFDLQRILIGDLPALFWVEILLRTLVLYAFSLAFIRILGKRSAGELTSVDVILIVALGSAVGDPMFYPNVPLLHGLVVIALVISLQRLVIFSSNNIERAERFIKGRPDRIIVDGEFDLEGRRNAAVSNEEVFGLLREHGYRNLGQVERLYIEMDGAASHYAFDEEEVRPGLPLVPPWEVDEPIRVTAGSELKQNEVLACQNCGHVIYVGMNEIVPRCPQCNKKTWMHADYRGVKQEAR